MSLKSRAVLVTLILGSVYFNAAHCASADVKVALEVAGPAQELRVWDTGALGKLKRVASSEKDPATGKVARFQGVLLADLIDKSIEKVALDSKAQVDLVVLKNAQGAQVLLPRSVIVKYPVMLAQEGDQVSVVMPWTSKPRIMQENLPVESYFLTDLRQIELSNYQVRYASVFLKRRTDPLAMRGEKLFVQNCIGCHADGSRGISQISGEPSARKLVMEGHPQPTRGVPKLSEKDRKALAGYLLAYRTENTPPSVASH